MSDPEKNDSPEDAARPRAPLAPALRFWVKLGLTSFGGAPAQIAMMHGELVERRGWVGETRFRHDLALCQSLPGPEGQQLAALSAMRLHGWAAGVFAGAAFVIPGALFMLTLGLTLPGPEKLGMLWLGLRAGALALLIPSAWSMLRRNHSPAAHALSAFGAVASIAGVPQPLTVVCAGVAGWFFFKTISGATEPSATPPSPAKILAGVTAIALPFVVALAALGPDNAIVHGAKTALRIAGAGFGGAYALLPEAFRVFSQLGPLPPGLLADATTLAESSPGPTLLAVQHGAFVTASTFPGQFSPVTSGVLGALLCSWCLFATSTMVVLIGAPFADRLTGRPGLRAAMVGVGAAATGQIAGLIVPVAIAATPVTAHERTVSALIFAAGLLFVLRAPRLGWLAVPLCGLLGYALFR